MKAAVTGQAGVQTEVRDLPLASSSDGLFTVRRLIPLQDLGDVAARANHEEVSKQVLDLADRSQWRLHGSGLVFPPRQDSLERINTEPQTVILLYVRREVPELGAHGPVAGYLLMHLGSAINRHYAGLTADYLEGLGSPLPAFIRSVCVDPEIRRRGLGQALLRGGLTVAEQMGASALAGHVKVQPGRDERLITAFSNAGFIERPDKRTVRVTKENDGSFRVFEDHPWCREQCPHVVEIEYQVWVAPTPSFTLVGGEGQLRCVPRA